MKRGSLMKRLTVFGLAVAVIGCMAVPVLAAEDPDAYTIRVFSGAKGTYNAEQTIKASYGDKVTFYPVRNTTVTDEKYYVKGIREAGLDNDEAIEESSITVTEDKDYVIAYGIKGTSVAYTINYQDAAGNTLADSETYYGNVGDKPVVAYLYIEGYQPQAYNLTKTLSENESENQFTFVYSVNEGEVTTVTNTTTTTVTTSAAATTATGTATGTAAGGTAAGGTAATGGAGAGVTDAGTAPADIVDLDDGDFTLAGVDGANGNNGDGTDTAGDEATINDEQTPLAGISTAAKAGIGLIIAAAIIVIIAILVARARRRKDQEEL